MTQLASLTAFIENNLPARAHIPFTSDMDDITLLPFTKSLGHGQLCTQVRKYTAFLRWDAWPYRQLNPDLVFSLVEARLADNGGDLRQHWHRMRQPLTSKWMMKMKLHGWKSVCRWLIPSPRLRMKTAPSPEAGNVTGWKSLKSGWLRRISFTVR